VQIAWVQRDTFDGSGFPDSRMGRAYVTESGPTWATGAQAIGKSVSELILSGEELVERRKLLEYNGTGKATAAALAAGPDGLYFSDLYKDEFIETPIDRGANIFRIRWTGYPDFTVQASVSPDPLLVRFADKSYVPDAVTWRWEFGDGTSSSERNPEHRYPQPGTYLVRLRVNEQYLCTRKVRVGAEAVPLRAEYYSGPDFTGSVQTRSEPSLAVAMEKADPFSVRWTGTLSPRFSERYTLQAETEGDVRVIIGDQVVISGDDRTVEIDFEAGTDYPIIVEYRHGGGPVSVSVTWESATQSRLPVPRSSSLPRRRAVR
jgi:hypothetical protein